MHQNHPVKNTIFSIAVDILVRNFSERVGTLLLNLDTQSLREKYRH
jgi:hypothetical protein